MRFAFKSFLIASAFAMVGSVQAESVTGTLTNHNDLTGLGWEFSGLTGSGSLTFSAVMISALNKFDPDVSDVAPAGVNVARTSIGRLSGLSVNAPLVSSMASFDGFNLSLNSLATVGGVDFRAVDDEFSTKGGHLTISNLRVNFDTRTISADVDGGNDYGRVDGLDLWRFIKMSGTNSLIASDGVLSSTISLSGLVVTPGGYEAFKESLGMLEPSIAALNRVTDYGSFVFNVSTRAMPVPIPEPSAFALLFSGLAAAFGAQRIRRL